jgi:hypothetical protein
MNRNQRLTYQRLEVLALLLASSGLSALSGCGGGVSGRQHLEGLTTVTGRVLNLSGQPAVGVPVRLYGADLPADPIAGGQTDGDGRFVLSGIPAGRIHLAMHDGMGSGDLREIDLEALGENDAGDIPLAPMTNFADAVLLRGLGYEERVTNSESDLFSPAISAEQENVFALRSVNGAIQLVRVSVDDGSITVVVPQIDTADDGSGRPIYQPYGDFIRFRVAGSWQFLDMSTSGIDPAPAFDTGWGGTQWMGGTQMINWTDGLRVFGFETRNCVIPTVGAPPQCDVRVWWRGGSGPAGIATADWLAARTGLAGQVFASNDHLVYVDGPDLVVINLITAVTTRHPAPPISGWFARFRAVSDDAVVYTTVSANCDLRSDINELKRYDFATGTASSLVFNPDCSAPGLVTAVFGNQALYAVSSAWSILDLETGAQQPLGIPVSLSTTPGQLGLAPDLGTIAAVLPTNDGWRLEFSDRGGAGADVLDIAFSGAKVRTRRYPAAFSLRTVASAPQVFDVASVAFGPSGFTQLFLTDLLVPESDPQVATYLPADHSSPFVPNLGFIFYFTLDPVSGHQQLFRLATRVE